MRRTSARSSRRDASAFDVDELDRPQTSQHPTGVAGAQTAAESARNQQAEQGVEPTDGGSGQVDATMRHRATPLDFGNARLTMRCSSQHGGVCTPTRVSEARRLLRFWLEGCRLGAERSCGCQSHRPRGFSASALGAPRGGRRNSEASPVVLGRPLDYDVQGRRGMLRNNANSTSCSLSASLTDGVHVRALNDPADWGPSDHRRILIELET